MYEVKAMKKMLAAVLDAPGEGDVLSLREVEIADPGPMEVSVRSSPEPSAGRRVSSYSPVPSLK